MLKRWIAVIVAMLSLAIIAPLAFAAGGLSGSYRTKISKPASIKGVWKIKFASGHTTVSWNGKVVTHGKYTISGSTITLKPKGKCHSPGKYNFKLSGRTLKFTKISDPCPSPRSKILSHRFTKV
jgi:hypothetical protein